MATYYVRPTNGSDVAAGTTFGAAFQTTQKALDTAVAGDYIRLCNEATETPSAKIDIDTNAGSSTNPIVVQAGDSTDGTLLTSGHYTISGSSLPATTDLVDYSLANNYIKFDRVRFTAATRDNFIITNTPRIIFRYCRFDNATSDGLYTTNATTQRTFIAIGCEIDSNGAYGANVNSLTGRGFGTWIACSVHDNTSGGLREAFPYVHLIGNVFYDNAGIGITTTNSTSHYWVAFGNTFVLNDGNQVDLQSAMTGFSVMYNNVFRSGGAYGVDTATADLEQVVMDYNCSHNNTSGHIDINSGVLPGANNVTSDPSFESETDASEDFEPASGSPLIGAGFPGALPAGGTGYQDIGALQREMAAGVGGGLGISQGLHTIGSQVSA